MAFYFWFASTVGILLGMDVMEPRASPSERVSEGFLSPLECLLVGMMFPMFVLKKVPKMSMSISFFCLMGSAPQKKMAWGLV